MSVQDIKVLTDLANGNPSALGSYRMLSAYERARLRDMKLRVSAIAVLNEVSKSLILSSKVCAQLIGCPAFINSVSKTDYAVWFR